MAKKPDAIVAETPEYVEVTLASNASTTLYFKDVAISFVDGKAQVTPDIAAALKDAGHTS